MFLCISTVHSPPRVGWMKRKLNSMQVSKQVLQDYNDVMENDEVIADIQESLNDVMKKNKKCEAVATQLLKCVEKTKGVGTLDEFFFAE